MKYSKLGKSDLALSEVSFGCMSLEGDPAVNVRMLHRALDSGINYFDTADLYQAGENERTVGKAFKGMRDRVLIGTKVGNQLRSDGSGWDWNPRKSYILEAVDKSLQRLKTDYIDLYQLHGGTIDDPIDETIEAFELLQEQGKIRCYGISSIRPNVIREYVQRSNIVGVMMQYSLLDRRPEENCLHLLSQHEIGVLSRGSLAKGLLAGKAPDPYLGYSAEEVAAAAEAVKSVAGEDRPAAEVAVRYVLNHPAIASAVVGIRTEKQLQEAIQAGEGASLATEQIHILRESVQANTYDKHR